MNPTRALAAGVLLSAGLLSLAAPTGAEPPAVPVARVDVVKVQGVIDPALAAYVRGTIQEAQRFGATVILQLDSRGSYGGEAQALALAIRSATVPVVTWAGPGGARVSGGALFVEYASSLAAMAPGAGLGPGRPFDLATTAAGEKPADVAVNSAALATLAPGSESTVGGVLSLVHGDALAAGPAQQRGAVALVAADVPDLLRKLDGMRVQTPGGPVTLATEGRSGRPVAVRFHEIGPWWRILHAVSTPTAVYVLLVLSLWGVAFEFTQPGFGVAGIGGALALGLAGYGLSVVPVRWLGVAVILAGVLAQGLDVVVRRLRWLTIGGTLLFAAGSILAWRGVDAAIDVPAWLIVMATLAGVLFFGFGMTVALRARERIRTAQIGLVGLVGEVRSELNPEGGVFVKGSLWRARSQDGAIPRGARVRVRSVDGLILRVDQEPDEPSS